MVGNTKKTRKQDKGIVVGICLAVIAVIAAVVAVVVSVINNGVSGGEFVTTDTRYVIEYPEEFFAETRQDYEPNRVYVVYEHDGDTVTGKTMYYEYDDAGTASETIDVLKENLVPEAYTEMVAKGKYIVITASEAIIKDMTMSDAESEKEFVEGMKQMYEETKQESEVTEEDGATTEVTVEETVTE